MPAIARQGKQLVNTDLKTVLVADDEHLVASGLAASLVNIGYEVVGPASSAEEAIEMCRATPPDLALLDIQMPGDSGIVAARTIFEQFGTPALIISAYSDPEYVNDAGETGVFGYLLKPVTCDQLRVAISVAWKRFKDYCKQHEEIGTLKQRLEERKIIEKAKWIIVQRKEVDESEAMRILQRHARDNRRSLPDVAASIIENADLFTG